MIRTLASSIALGIALLACSGGGGSVGAGTGTGSSTIVGQQGTLTAPSSGLSVTAALSSVSLGDDCGGGAKAPAEADFAAGACAEGQPCGAPCQQSNLQLVFTAGSGSASAKVRITAVTLHDAGGTQIEALTSRNPRAWRENGYAAWDETIAPSSETKATYDISAPTWSKIGDGAKTRSAKFLVRVTVDIDGESITLESTAVSREPEVVT